MLQMKGYKMEEMQRVDPQSEYVSAGQDLALFEHWVQVFSPWGI